MNIFIVHLDTISQSNPRFEKAQRYSYDAWCWGYKRSNEQNYPLDFLLNFFKKGQVMWYIYYFILCFIGLPATYVFFWVHFFVFVPSDWSRPVLLLRQFISQKLRAEMAFKQIFPQLVCKFWQMLRLICVFYVKILLL